ncbi:MAG: calcium/sodium antiporter [Rhodobacteraceae bacterium]|nr:calcium/sodium antiporter [Paracoccaceae bacterium]MCF8513920.1 calcium/sodium antiporter [Paracoccaceae bacterium]MCF8518164.1 calcium/sodium antiporter [Paracoccaceae bacterium]
MTYLLFALGLVALLVGGEFLVRGASGLARRMNLSPMVIGLTVVGFGTSAPELLVSVQAALAGQPGLAIGNVLGSNIANILLILGTSAAIAALVIPLRSVWRDLGIMLLATAMVWFMLLDGTISRFDGIVLVFGLIGFLASAFLLGEPEVPDEDAVPSSLPLAIVMTLGGLVALVIGARLLVDSASEIARTFGVSEAVIGLTVVAVGTSLPELATSVIAALRRQTDIAVGNVIGSNIFNVLAILGITALISPIPADPRFASVDMVWVAGASVLLVAMAFGLRGVPRWAGFALLATYAVYVGLTAL